MAYDDVLADRVRAALRAESGISERRMMGSLAFMKDGDMIGGVEGSRLFVRVDPTLIPELVLQADVGPMSIGGKALKSFVAIGAGAVSADPDLSRWLDVGLQAVSAS